MMFSLVFWIATAVLTVAWALTHGEWFGFGVAALLAGRIAMLVFCIGALFDAQFVRRQRALYRRPPASVQIGDYALDFVFLCALGWLAQNGLRYGFACVVLYAVTIILWEIMRYVLEPQR